MTKAELIVKYKERKELIDDQASRIKVLAQRLVEVKADLKSSKEKLKINEDLTLAYKKQSTRLKGTIDIKNTAIGELGLDVTRKNRRISALEQVETTLVEAAADYNSKPFYFRAFNKL